MVPSGPGVGPRVALLRSGLRVVGAWLAFPAVYYVFGMLLMALCPWARRYYEEGQAGLHLPALGTVVLVQLLRSALFLVSVLPVPPAWRGSRTPLAWTLGLAYWALVGLLGMIQAPWMPATLRVAHAIEIPADSLVSAWALVPATGERVGT